MSVAIWAQAVWARVGWLGGSGVPPALGGPIGSLRRGRRRDGLVAAKASPSPDGMAAAPAAAWRGCCGCIFRAAGETALAGACPSCGHATQGPLGRPRCRR